MANDPTSNPWRLDTTGVITANRTRLLGVRWVGATTAGHVCLIHDGLGKVIWHSIAAGDNYVESDTLHPQRLYPGVTLTTLGSGVVYLELG